MELLIVVALLGIISGLFYARTAAAKRDAADAHALTVLDTLRQATQAYAIRTGRWPNNITSGPATYWDPMVSQIEGVVGDLRLPRWAEMSALFPGTGVRTSATAVSGHDYSIWLKPASGQGSWWVATPYAVYSCPGANAAFDVTGCTLSK